MRNWLGDEEKTKASFLRNLRFVCLVVGRNNDVPLYNGALMVMYHGRIRLKKTPYKPTKVGT